MNDFNSPNKIINDLDLLITTFNKSDYLIIYFNPPIKNFKIPTSTSLQILSYNYENLDVFKDIIIKVTKRKLYKNIFIVFFKKNDLKILYKEIISNIYNKLIITLKITSFYSTISSAKSCFYDYQEINNLLNNNNI